MTFQEYLNEVHKAFQQYRSWRKGQTLFNILAAHRLDLSEQIRGTHLDPFYKNTDEECQEFLQWVEEHWDAGNRTAGRREQDDGS